MTTGVLIREETVTSELFPPEESIPVNFDISGNQMVATRQCTSTWQCSVGCTTRCGGPLGSYAVCGC